MPRSSKQTRALVTVLGSGVDQRAGLYIGGHPGNQLVISNGAAVLTAGAGFVGLMRNARFELNAVTDPGTRWLLSSNLLRGKRWRVEPVRCQQRGAGGKP